MATARTHDVWEAALAQHTGLEMGNRRRERVGRPPGGEKPHRGGFGAAVMRRTTGQIFVDNIGSRSTGGAAASLKGTNHPTLSPNAISPTDRPSAGPGQVTLPHHTIYSSCAFRL